MERLEIKNDILYIADDRGDYQMTLSAIDIACTDGYVINLKLYDGSQAFLHPEYEFVREDFNKLVKLLTKYSNFYQCDGYMVINLDNLQECNLDEKPNSCGYYKMRFARMQGGIATNNLDSAQEIEKNVNTAKQNYDAKINSTTGD